MNSYISKFIMILFLTSFSCKTVPKKVLFVHDYNKLEMNRQIMKMEDTNLERSRNEIVKAADKILKRKRTYTITDKIELPPSGDVHDFYSLAMYWWPNPETENGLPYIPKDGHPYPGRNKIKDQKKLENLSKDIYTLGLAYFYTKNNDYAKWSKNLVYIFFIDDKTKMNPNLEYAQIIRGKPGIGGATISGMPLVLLTEGIQLIRPSSIWTSQDQRMISAWFANYTSWMLHSAKGKKQRNARNNIGVYYTVQAVTYALFSGQKGLAKKILEEDYPKRISEQISSSGAMPHELKRKNSWSYVSYTLRAWKYLVALANNLNIDLWEYETTDGKSIKKAFQWLVPYALEQKQWEYGKGHFTPEKAKAVLKRSSFFNSDEIPELEQIKMSDEHILTN